MNTKEKAPIQSDSTQNAEKRPNLFLTLLARIPLSVKIIIPIALLLLICVAAVIFGGKDSSNLVTTISKSSLEEIMEISDLSTVEYTYNAIATKQDKKQNDMYYVAYEGKVTAGIDFNKISIDIDDKEKQILIRIPPVEIQDFYVDLGSLSYIFTKDKYETEDISQDAYNLCKYDLKLRTVEDSVLLQTAKENAITSIEALLKPWVDSIDSRYIVIVK